MRNCILLIVTILVLPWGSYTHTAIQSDAEPIKLLFLGDNGHHRPPDRFRQIQPVLAGRGIELTYTDKLDDLNADTLANYDGLVVYANHTSMSAEQERALMEFVEGGKGFIALHCASACFGNSSRYVALVGGRFSKHGFGQFRARIIDAQHPAMSGLRGFEVTDEDYTHTDIAADIQALMVRDEAGGYEPSCWVRHHGKGRVFYTALGHDERTFGQPEFHRLVENGMRWATGRLHDELPPLEYVDSVYPIPYYTPGQRWGTEGKHIDKIAKPLPPDLSVQHMHLPEGFRAELFAAEPDIVKPLAGSWDERGRLWIIESVDYPNRLLDDPHENGNDRIKICEDSDGDGRADKFTVFAENLNIPTAIVHTHGGVVIACAPHLVFLKDTNGDDRADVREIILTGFGRGDTHAVTSNLRYGLDNWIWGVCGYSGGRVKIAEAEHSFRQCIFRFKLKTDDESAAATRATGPAPTARTPRVVDFEVITPTSNNTWGLGFSETGEVFASTANNQHLVHMAIPNRYFEAVRGWHGTGSAGIEDHKRVHPIVADFRQMDWHGGFTAAAGCEVYTARSFPSEYWNRAVFVCEPTARVVHLDWLAPRGSGFVARDGWNMVASSDPWFGPVDAKVGPDGALWILDWYNYIIQHNPTPAGFKTGRGNAYETPLRDQTHGRIYRVTYKAGDESPPSGIANYMRKHPRGSQLPRPAQKPTNIFVDAETSRLVDDLGHPNMWVRLTAQRLIVEYDLWHVEALLRKTVEDWMSERMRAVGSGSKPNTASPLDWLSPLAIRARHSQQILLEFAGRTTLTGIAALPDPAGISADATPLQWRISLNGLANAPQIAEVESAIVMMLNEPSLASDPWLAMLATHVAAKYDLRFLRSAAGSGVSQKTASTFGATVRVVAEHFARGSPADADLGDVLSRLRDADAVVVEAMVKGLYAGWNAERPPSLPPAAELALTGLLTRVSPEGRLALAQLAARWGIKGKFEEAVAEVRKSMLTDLADPDKGDAARVAAARQIVSIGLDDDTIGSLLELITPQSSPELSVGIVESLGSSGSDEIGAALVARWSSLTPITRRAALAALVKRPAWSRALLDAIEHGRISAADLASDQTQSLTSHPDKAIAEQARTVLARKGRLPDPDRQKVMDEFEVLASQIGDVAAGKAAFVKHCAKCHKHSGEGTNVGPDLSGMAVHPKIELLTNILDPSRSVEGNYRAYLIATKDGRVLTGLLASETRTALELFDPEGKKQVVLREDIDELIESPKSLMPDGFEKQLAKDEIVNLLEFLAARGRYLPLDLRKVATVVSTKGMFNSEESQAERLVFRDWSPKVFDDVPFHLVDPQGDRVANAILLHGPQGKIPPQMPKSVKLPCNAPAQAIHMLSGVSGWGFPIGEKGSVTLVVRLHYADGSTEDHELRNGVHFADYIRVVEVPESKLAFRLRGQQLRYLAVRPQRAETIREIEFIKGSDATAPIIMAVTIEAP